MAKVSILMLTYNAPLYAIHSIKSIKNYTLNEVDYELIVYDNNSSDRTKKILKKLKDKGYIDKLVFSDVNYYFVGGNNRASTYVDDKSEFILLLNSDIEIRNGEWLSNLLKVHKRGITACQVCAEIDNRPDGWCLLVDKDIYNNFKLDESRFTWYFSIADFGSRVMRSGFSVQTIKRYDNFIFHFGKASEVDKNVEAMGKDLAHDIDSWYPQKCHLIDEILMSKSTNVKHNYIFYIYHFWNKIKKK